MIIDFNKQNLENFILNELNSKTFDRSKENIIKHMESIYGNNSFGLQHYYVIKTKLVEIIRTDENSVIYENVALILENSNKEILDIDNENDEDFYIQFLIMSDFIYIELEELMNVKRVEYYIRKDLKKETHNIKEISNSLIKDIKVSRKEIEELKTDIKNSKLDIVGLISGVLSLFTIFGANYSFIVNFLSNNSRNIWELLGIYTVFNVVLVSTLLAFMWCLKKIF